MTRIREEEEVKHNANEMRLTSNTVYMHVEPTVLFYTSAPLLVAPLISQPNASVS